MASTKTRTRPGKQPRSKPAANGTPTPEVLTLAEAAAYLRIATDEVLRLVDSDGLPGRPCGTEWRFLKSALQVWLSTPQIGTSNGSLWTQQFGALKDDPYLEEMLAEIYRQRGRPETEEA